MFIIIKTFPLLSKFLIFLKGENSVRGITTYYFANTETPIYKNL